MNLELKNPKFYKKTLYIMAPVVLQQLITIGVNFCDNLMVGSFGEIQISAASFSNQFYSFFQFICMGIGSGAVVMSSQFWGRGDIKSMRKATAIAIRITLILCSFFALSAAVVPNFILQIFTDDAQIVKIGAPYLRALAITFLLSGLSSTATYLLRSAGEVRIPLAGSIGAFLLNVFFNWVFIFGKLGAPRLELLGAALGTIIARTFEFCFIFGYFILKDKKISFRFKHLIKGGRGMLRDYAYYAFPVLISDTLLGFSLSLSAVIIGRTGREASSANAIVSSIVQLVNVLNMGMSGAAAIIIGNSIGEGKIERAKRESKTYVILSFLMGFVIIVPLLIVWNSYVGLYNITDETRDIASSIITFLCFVMPIETVAYMTSKGILRGGGDARFLLLADSSLIWFVSLPLGALASFVWNLSPVVVYIFLRIEYPLKGVLCFIRFCTGKWISIIGKDKKDSEKIQGEAR